MFSRCVEMVEKNSHLSLQHLRIASKRELSKVLVMQGNEEEALLLFEQYLGLTISVARSFCMTCGKACDEDEDLVTCGSCGVRIGGNCCKSDNRQPTNTDHEHANVCMLLRRWNEVLRGKEDPRQCRPELLAYLTHAVKGQHLRTLEDSSYDHIKDDHRFHHHGNQSSIMAPAVSPQGTTRQHTQPQARDTQSAQHASDGDSAGASSGIASTDRADSNAALPAACSSSASFPGALGVIHSTDHVVPSSISSDSETEIDDFCDVPV